MKITEKRQLLAEAKRFNPYVGVPKEEIKMFKKNGAYAGVAFGHSAYYQWTPLKFSLRRWKRDYRCKAIQLLDELKKNPFMQEHLSVLEGLEIKND
mgnify:CR=1 FL=1|tara:strand:+ start:77 stop:364 length:288 start_codon:yes stop_codon:yes gene_type:complete